MHRFTYNDTVRVKPDAPSHLRPGELASVVAVNREEDRRGEFLRQYPKGFVYTVEFDDGAAVQAHESLVEKAVLPCERS
jgi:hypothetical protein